MLKACSKGLFSPKRKYIHVNSHFSALVLGDTYGCSKYMNLTWIKNGNVAQNDNVGFTCKFHPINLLLIVLPQTTGNGRKNTRMIKIRKVLFLGLLC